MSEIAVQQATMDDAGAISALFRRRIGVWQRFDAEGRVEELPYEALTIHERWLHGGAWMSLETSTIFLSHLLCGGGIALVAVAGEEVIGYAEAYPGNEPDPYGEHLHIAHLVGQPEREDSVKDALMEHLFTLDTRRLTAAFSCYDADSAEFYQRHGMQPLARIKQYTIPAQTGQSFYKAIEYHPFDHTRIAGWEMPVGRMQSARQHWETLWPRLWQAFPEIVARKTHRLQVSAAGQEAFVCYQQQLFAPRSVEVYCWSPRPLTKQLLIAIRDWAHREDYRSLVFAVPEPTAKLFGQDFEENPYQQDVYAVTV